MGYKPPGLGAGIPLNLKKDSMVLGGGKLPQVAVNSVLDQAFQIPSARGKQPSASNASAVPSGGQNSRLVRNASRGHAEGGGSNDRRPQITNKLITSSTQGNHIGSMPLA